jgi:hypothetical protein
MTATSLSMLRLVAILAFGSIPAAASISPTKGTLQRWMSARESTPPPSHTVPYQLLPVPPLAGASYRSEQGLPSWIVPSPIPPAPAYEGPGLISRDFELLALYEQTESYARIIEHQNSDPWLLNALLSALIKFGGRFITANFSYP